MTMTMRYFYTDELLNNLHLKGLDYGRSKKAMTRLLCMKMKEKGAKIKKHPRFGYRIFTSVEICNEVMSSFNGKLIPETLVPKPYISFSTIKQAISSLKVREKIDPINPHRKVGEILGPKLLPKKVYEHAREIEGFIRIDNVWCNNKKDTVFYCFPNSQEKLLDNLLIITQEIIKDEERIKLLRQKKQEDFEDGMGGLPDDFE